MGRKQLGLLKPDDTLVKGAVHTQFDSLPEKQKVFIRELHKNGWNKTQAALKAGSKNASSAIVTANNWLKLPKVQMAIEEFQALDNRANNLQVDDLKVELWKNHLRATRVSDSNKSLELILRLMGAFKEQVEVTQSVGLAQILDDLSDMADGKSGNIDVVSKFETKPDNGEQSPDNDKSD